MGRATVPAASSSSSFLNHHHIPSSSPSSSPFCFFFIIITASIPSISSFITTIKFKSNSKPKFQSEKRRKERDSSLPTPHPLPSTPPSFPTSFPLPPPSSLLPDALHSSSRSDDLALLLLRTIDPALLLHLPPRRPTLLLQICDAPPSSTSTSTSSLPSPPLYP